MVGPQRVAAVPAGTDFVVSGTLPYYRAIARARYFVNNVNWPNHLVKRRGTTHVMTHHGTPLKMMGMDQLDHPAAVDDTNFAAQMRRADRWDVSVTANAHTTMAWERAYPCRYETLEVGYPRNDRLATATAGDIAAARAELGLAEGRRVVLYLPTHREWLPVGDPVLDVEQLAEELGPDTTLLVRTHYFYVPPGQTARAASGGGRIVDVSGHPVVEDLYLAADVLLTDYSSAMFDYAVLDRPVVIYAPDWPVYRELRGVYFDLLAEPPGAVATDFRQLDRDFPQWGIRERGRDRPAAAVPRPILLSGRWGCRGAGGAPGVSRATDFDGRQDLVIMSLRSANGTFTRWRHIDIVVRVRKIAAPTGPGSQRTEPGRR